MIARGALVAALRTVRRPPEAVNRAIVSLLDRNAKVEMTTMTLSNNGRYPLAAANRRCDVRSVNSAYSL